jgi:hypothetical protein
MAEEAFALSPISARAALPREEDYAAISEAFMETSRGRWFLGEYARRNRNADTRMVLDAVARIEESLGSQRQATSDTRLTEALEAIRQAVGEAHDFAVPVADVETFDPQTAAPEIEVEMAEQAMEASVSAAAPVEDPAAFAAPVETADEDTAHDEAMLDLIAAEMAAPDPFADDFEMVTGEVFVAQPAPVPPEPVTESAEPIAARAEPPAAPSPPEPVPAPAPEPAMEVSLGSTIIASGMLKKAGAPANDPLAPIRRMSQAEKIAFFS